MRYLLITHIPFARQPGDGVLLDRLWAEDLKGLVNAMGPITVAAPEILDAAKMQSWGPGFTALTEADGITMVGVPIRKNRLDIGHGRRLRKVLHRAVLKADLVHTSNLFDPNTPLYYAGDLAARMGKKTLFVVAEDFYDMLQWEWVRTAPAGLTRWRRQRTLARLDREVRQRVSTASLTFLHTPAAVARYRSDASNGIAIRQPVHELEDVITEADLEARCKSIANGQRLEIVAACRMQPLKGMSFLLRAIAILKLRGKDVNARLYGDGESMPALKALAKTLGIDDRVEFPGSLSPASILRAGLAKGHVFLMPHLTSDFGRGFFDAMAAGLPVIAFRSIASEDTVRDGIDGLLAANADAESLADCIAAYHEDRTELVAAAASARQRALDNTKSFWSDYRAGMIRELFEPAE